MTKKSLLQLKSFSSNSMLGKREECPLNKYMKAYYPSDFNPMNDDIDMIERDESAYPELTLD